VEISSDAARPGRQRLKVTNMPDDKLSQAHLDPRRGRFIAPTADLSAPGEFPAAQSNLKQDYVL
jgi:hypothetical protein